ncbi:MAG: phosphoenolpyruvate--protein phosphotransferase [Elusimicrobia bacterium]|nr:phosphoenolpyruvate--protein phosphotransferase [Elusimicrobiota bacterium]
MLIIKGTVLTEGMALGGACLYREDIFAAAPKRTLEEDEVPAEKARLATALEGTRRDLQHAYDKAAKQLSETEAGIFRVHIMILEDPSFVEPMLKRVAESLVNAESAVVLSLAEYEKQFQRLPNDYLRERIQDLNDIASRILRRLGLAHAGFRCHCAHKAPVVLVADTLSASLIAGLGDKPLAGIVSESGSKISHGAILAKNLGVPVIAGVKGALSHVGCGTRILIDGFKGEAVFDPDPETLARSAARLRRVAAAGKSRDLADAATKDGVKVRLLANASCLADVAHARERGLRDIGLFRTEALFLGRDKEPGFDEQVESYRKVMAAAEGSVTFRLLDIGGDKLISYLPFPKEDNPNLGLKGARVYEEYPELLATQTRALLVAAHARPVKIMIPMVSTIEEFLKARATVRSALRRLESAGAATPSRVSVGCMIEVPAAVYVVRDLAEEADFLSVGTNDLIQYVMGADRMNARLAEYHDPLQPAVVKVLRDIAAQAGPLGKELSLCGEIASEPAIAKLLVGLGYRALSVNPYQAGKLSDCLAAASLAELERLAADLLKAKTLASARKLILEPASA